MQILSVLSRKPHFFEKFIILEVHFPGFKEMYPLEKWRQKYVSSVQKFTGLPNIVLAKYEDILVHVRLYRWPGSSCVLKVSLSMAS